MPIKKHKPEQIVLLLRQIEVGIANGKTTPQEKRKAGGGWAVHVEKTGEPRTSKRGEMPRPGAVEEARRPWLRCGAPSAMLRVT